MCLPFKLLRHGIQSFRAGALGRRVGWGDVMGPRFGTSGIGNLQDFEEMGC